MKTAKKLRRVAKSFSMKGQRNFKQVFKDIVYVNQINWINFLDRKNNMNDRTGLRPA